MREDFSFVEASSFPGDFPGDGQTLAVMKKNFPVFRNFGFPVPQCSGMGGHG